MGFRTGVGFFAFLLAACQGPGALADSAVGVELGNTFVNRPAESGEHRSGEKSRRNVVRTCLTIESEANRSGLPPGFFARLIWKESRFDPDAVSPKGARGIAQFMPGTARERGLADPFDPETALAASAAFLVDLKGRFGNLGLAAAAYNAGPDRVARWRNNTSRLPAETHDFVRAITGMTVNEWVTPDPAVPDFALHETLPFSHACLQLARTSRPTRRRSIAEDIAIKPWGALIAMHFTRDGADALLTRLAGAYPVVARHQPIEFIRRRNPARGGAFMYRVMLGADDRNAADTLCSQMNDNGGACIVVRN